MLPSHGVEETKSWVRGRDTRKSESGKLLLSLGRKWSPWRGGPGWWLELCGASLGSSAMRGQEPDVHRKSSDLQSRKWREEEK